MSGCCPLCNAPITHLDEAKRLAHEQADWLLDEDAETLPHGCVTYDEALKQVLARLEAAELQLRGSA